jgi:hypothetical protein
VAIHWTSVPFHGG